jgi:CubicO group peptidase (beta-lactamase class C family)/beta-glucosidase-like glycosyl hydrolase
MFKGVFFNLLVLLLLLIVSPSNGLNVLEIRELKEKNEDPKKTYYYDYLHRQQRWIDSLVRDMSLDEKIGQLFIAFTQSQQNQAEIEELIKIHHIGGIVLFKDSPSKQVNTINLYQSLSRIPLLIGADSEIGLSNVVDSVPTFPQLLTTRAIQNEQLITQTGIEIARQYRRLGIHFNLGLQDSLINNSFTDWYAKGMFDKGVLHVLKNFENKEENPLIGISLLNHQVKQGIAHQYAATDLVQLFENHDLIITKNIDESIAEIKKAVAEGKISERQIENKLYNALKAKFATGLFAPKSVNPQNIIKDLYTAEAKAINEKLYEQAITLVKNEGNLIPFAQLDKLSFASVSIGAKEDNDFQRFLSKYAPFESYAITSKNAFDNPHLYNTICEKIQNKSVVIIGVHNIVSEDAKKFIQNIQTKTQVIVVVFGEPILLQDYQESNHLICAYEDNTLTQLLLPQLLFGAVSNHARLPIDVSEKLPKGTGHFVPLLTRLRYTSVPESVGVNSAMLARIDTIAQMAIDMKATPGCQVVVARKGVVLFNKNYGYYTYEKSQPVTDNTIYDLASLTKVVATMQAIMHLYEKGKINLNEKVSTYLPDLKGTNKGDLILRDILIHQAGLVQQEPFWWKAMSRKEHKQNYLRSIKSDSFNIQVNENLFASSTIKDSIWKWTSQLELRKKKGKDNYGYLYSDIGFYILKQIAEKHLQKPINEFVENELYKPLGLATMTYLPIQKFSKEQIAPTEEDNHFRKNTVQGYVHDPDAALAGGIAGHAGVFSNANDLAILGQMHLQNGYYGGRKYYESGTIPYFTEKRQVESNRRGLGWDKPIRGFGGPSSGYCSPATYGHTGFTGTCIWIDPKYDLIFIFLTNKSYPIAHNRKLNNENIRNKIHNTIYQAMEVQDSYVVLEKQNRID